MTAATTVRAPRVALALGVSAETIRRWAERGQIPSARRTPGGTWLFDPIAVAEWWAAEATPEPAGAAGPTTEVPS